MPSSLTTSSLPESTEQINPIYTIQSLVTTTFPLVTTTPPLITLPSRRTSTTNSIEFMSTLPSTLITSTESESTIISNVIDETTTIPMEIITKKTHGKTKNPFKSKLTTTKTTVEPILENIQTNELEESTKINVILITEGKNELERDEMTTLATIPSSTLSIAPKTTTLSKKLRNKFTSKSKLKFLKHRTSKLASTPMTSSSKRTLSNPVIITATKYIDVLKPIMFGN